MQEVRVFYSNDENSLSDAMNEWIAGRRIVHIKQNTFGDEGGLYITLVVEDLEEVEVEDFEE